VADSANSKLKRDGSETDQRDLTLHRSQGWGAGEALLNITKFC
jgi:hypothetical protein